MESEVLGNDPTKGTLLLKAVIVEVGECRRQKDRIIQEEALNSTEWSEF